MLEFFTVGCLHIYFRDKALCCPNYFKINDGNCTGKRMHLYPVRSLYFHKVKQIFLFYSNQCELTHISIVF